MASFVFLADLHLGEGCASAATGYLRNDTSCYSWAHLNATVQKVNAIIDSRRASSPVGLVLVGGDLSASAQPSEFATAKALLDRLAVPYLPIMGNHDVWSYSARGDWTATPEGDSLFAATFGDTFASAAALSPQSVFVYPNSTAHSPSCNCSTRFQSWEFRPAADFDRHLAGLTFLAPDWNTRLRAPPPCPNPSHLPVGGCGVPGQAALHAHAGGVMPWFESRLQAIAERGAQMGSVLLLTHQPFRCRFPIPDWAFCFSTNDKASVRAAIDRHGQARSFFGQLAGHQHRWFHGDAFDEAEWKGFVQWENSAVKGDVSDGAMASSFSVFEVELGHVVGVTRFWQEHGTWKTQAVDIEIRRDSVESASGLRSPARSVPTPPSVPLEYAQRFSMSDGSTGLLNYDWPHRRQRVAHSNSTASRKSQCFFWYNTTEPCIEYFTSNSEQYVYFPNEGSCCLESCADRCPSWMNVSDGSCCREAAVGLPRPDSAAQCEYNSTVTWEGMLVYWFHCPACLNYYFDEKMRPRLFWANDHQYEVRFDIDSLRPGPQPADVFALPESCSPAVKCKGFNASPKIVCDSSPGRHR